jgi:E3 ubiquitin-protein ligase TRIP12
MPFNLTFYKWLLGQEESLTIEDLIHVDANLYEQLKKLQTIVNYRQQLANNDEHVDTSTIQKKRSTTKDDASCTSTWDLNDPRLCLDQCRIEDLSLVFTLPGYSHVELKKGGKDCPVTLNNLDQYVDVRQHKSNKTKHRSCSLFLVDCSLDIDRRCSTTISSVP